MAEPLQDNRSEDIQVGGEEPEVSSHGPSTHPEPEPEPKRETYPDPDAQNMVIESLRSQIQDLFSQVTQLNSKLVGSYDRVSHLEDQLHDSSNGLRSASVKISQLELERSQHLSALNSGLLVERTHVTAELTRLMEKATEEAARRGQAESARAEIEKELDDLSAGLFGQANTMVAEARLARAASERKVEETERALKGAEEAIANMQHHMQALHEEKEEALRQAEEMRVTVGKGKWSRRDSSTPVSALRHILNCTSQYQDFLNFVAHVRELRQKSNILPLITTVNHPWLARLQLEDSDPTVRLELSSSINWMNRRSVLLAIQQGQLDIEPVSSETFLQEHAAAQSGISGLGTGSSIICGLCGAYIMYDSSKSSTGMFQRQISLPTNAWSTFMVRQNSRSATPLQSPGIPKPTTIYIFRLAVDPYGTPQPGKSRPMYPLCASGWCLHRLRTTCNLWAFVRTGILEKVWEEAGLVASRRTSTGDASIQSDSEKQQDNSLPPPAAPPLRGRFGKLWERASSLGAGVVEKVSTTGPEKDRKNEEDAKRLPSPPPEPEEIPPKRSVPPLPATRTQASVPPHLPPHDQNGDETAAPPNEAPIPPQDSGVLFDYDHHDHPKHTEPPPERSITPSEPATPEPVVEKTRPPVLPPRAPRHPPADMVRPGTPSAIPLPDSRPSTPAPTTTAELHRSVPSTPTKLDRSSSPAPGPGVVPPPIPRRAPARVRPVSASLRPSTPLNQPPINPPEEKEEGKELSADPPTTISETANPVEKAAPPPVIEVVIRPTLGVIKSKVEPRQSDAETPQNVEQSSPVTVVDRSAASPVDDAPHAPGDGSGLLNTQNMVGDKSWEDKTWREVVRLREDMFYARLGIIR
ncbi:hypothetical protein BJ322DRAFT_1217162 [Thelephora terrestris]|uniref:GDP/GTP exchange factor Sec2 N-terminal domain-containing protein n=1 Tax=Thelephora terrestris TaxID=56493 RepID=A0A9P6HI78_9AGAM|nr:hypothetical protein BJ322DRAFT_1217162 [Thelephora terrestris]